MIYPIQLQWENRLENDINNFLNDYKNAHGMPHHHVVRLKVVILVKKVGLFFIK